MQEKHNKWQVLTRGSCVVLSRGKEEKSHCPGTEQLIPSVFAHHLINTSRFLPGAAVFQGWTQPCHHRAIFIHKQKISELERISTGKRYCIPLISGNTHSSSPDSGATSIRDAGFIPQNCCTLLKMQKIF